MATAEHQVPGVAKIAQESLGDFISHSFLFGVIAFIYSLPAIVIALLAQAELVSYILMSIAMFTIMITGSFLRSEDELDTEVYEGMTAMEAILNATVLYIIIGGTLTALFLWTSLLAAFATFVVGLPTMGVIIAILYPPIDRWIASQFRWLSIVEIAGYTISGILKMVFEIYNISRDIIDNTQRQARTLY